MGARTVVVQDVSVFFGGPDEITDDAEVYFSLGDSKFIVNITKSQADIYVSGAVLTGLPTMYALDPDSDIIIAHAYQAPDPLVWPWVTGFSQRKIAYVVVE